MTAIMFSNYELKEKMKEMTFDIKQINAVIEMLNEIRPNRIKWRNLAIHWLIENDVAVLKERHLHLKESSN